jgi:hypothetical protein
MNCHPPPKPLGHPFKSLHRSPLPRTARKRMQDRKLPRNRRTRNPRKSRSDAPQVPSLRVVELDRMRPSIRHSCQKLKRQTQVTNHLPEFRSPSPVPRNHRIERSQARNHVLRMPCRPHAQPVQTRRDDRLSPIRKPCQCNILFGAPHLRVIRPQRLHRRQADDKIPNRAGANQ